MAELWISNRYVRATRGNFTLTSTVGNDVAAVLANRSATDIILKPINDYFKPINDAYQAQFALLDAVSGVKEGATYGLKNALAGMRRKANSWRKAIANVYDERSEEYITLLPNGIGPFTTGKQTSILQAVEGFSGRLADFPSLSTTKTDVDATYLQLSAKNTTQKGKMGARDAASDALEAGRINLCKGLMWVEGALIQVFIDDLSQVDAFFPLNLLRRRLQTEFTGSIAAGVSKCIVKRKQEDDAEIRLRNSGLLSLTFYFAPAKDTPLAAGMSSKTITPMQDITVPVTELGASADNAFLIVKNSSDTGEGHWFIAL